MNISTTGDHDRIEQLELALHQVKTLLNAQLNVLDCGGDDFLLTLASVSVNICETALK